MIRTIILEDEPAVRKEMEWLMNQETDIELLGTAANVKDALLLIGSSSPDLVLMDIQLADGTAFDILQQLDKVPFHIIFITAYNHFAIKAIKYGALDYLLKPLDVNELHAALDKLRETGRHQTSDEQLAVLKRQSTPTEESLDNHLVLHTAEFIQVLQLREIMYCQADGSYTTFFFHDGRQMLVSKLLKHYDELLPERFFLRPHQSYLVNINCIDKVLKDGTIILKNGKEVPVSSRRKKYVLDRLTQLS